MPNKQTNQKKKEKNNLYYLLFLDQFELSSFLRLKLRP
jgi:hypothetical protein